ncbi:hypothetical protein BDY19DRAFT_274419 [Irpex rosettiformis]|uniref:Uncharacterized protein n=1 Tax=Irpex rosettiformis TaxID=378272 RepID=A0ACB8UHD9_9APHY|nr:hypothetical protein BDY19DRAFT_274419 [Irpex rosettiformis]
MPSADPDEKRISGTSDTPRDDPEPSKPQLPHMAHSNPTTVGGSDNDSASINNLPRKKGDGPTVKTVQIVGQATGWAAMAEDIRDYDENRVKECREDIDTLMTFAGLFSAALTAFLVESYHALLPSVAGETLQVLRLIARQNLDKNETGPHAAYSDLTLLATSESQVPSLSFNAIVIVNALWFGSLLLSLIAASFSMVVKQWLREYLAVNNPSAQARLRVRQFREPSLGNWKVFEIAAALPFLLQLALVLFFAGLCIFTASVHTVVGATSFTLVLAWALCFITVTFLPIFFPHCPYKTTFLKAALRWIRAWLLFLVGLMPRDTSTLYHRLPDETKVAKDATRDLDILIDVDELQADDELLGTNMLEGIGQFRRPELPELVKFLKHILNHRCQLVAKENPQPDDLPWPTNSDLLVLSDRGKKAVLDIIEKYACRDGLNREIAGFDKALNEICAFLVLPDLGPLPENCIELVRGRNSNTLLGILLEQWGRRCSEGFYRGVWASDIWDPFQHMDALYHSDSDQMCSHIPRLAGFYDEFLSDSFPMLVIQDHFSESDFAALGTFMCGNMQVVLQHRETWVTGTSTQASNPTDDRRDTFYKGASTVLNLVTRPQARPETNDRLQKGFASVLAAAFVTSDQAAKDGIFDACAHQNSTFFTGILETILVEARSLLSNTGEYGIPGYRYRVNLV